MSSKRRKHEEHENHERWLVSYADFITLLFAFFVVMYATSNNDEAKQQEFQESVRAELKLAVVGQGGASGQSFGDSIFAELLNPLDRFPRRGGPEEIRDYLERQIRRRLSNEEREKLGLEVRADRDGARLTFSAESFFPSGSARLKRSAVEGLHVVGAILSETEKRRIVVEGHTDDRPLKGGDIASNWELASLRATSVVRFLIASKGVDAERLAATSYADQRPLVPNTTEENRNKNRRIEILITE